MWGYQCNSSSYYGFSYIESSYSSTINAVIETSVSNCSATDSRTMCNYRGFINFSTVNLSYNKASSISALRCQPGSTSSTDIGTSITYSSFANNTAGSSYCIYLYYYINVCNKNFQQYYSRKKSK